MLFDPEMRVYTNMATRILLTYLISGLIYSFVDYIIWTRSKWYVDATDYLRAAIETVGSRVVVYTFYYGVIFLGLSVSAAWWPVSLFRKSFFPLSDEARAEKKAQAEKRIAEMTANWKREDGDLDA